MNKQPVPQSEKKPASKKALLILVLSILGLGIIWTIITVVVPLVAGDGLSGYTGAKQQAAKYALDHEKSMYDNKVRWAYSFHVDDVRPVSSSEISQICTNPAYITNDANSSTYYTVVMTQRTLFQLGSTAKTYVGCNPDNRF